MQVHVTCSCGEQYVERNAAVGSGSSCPSCRQVTILSSRHLEPAAGSAADPEPKAPPAAVPTDDFARDPLRWQQAARYHQARQKLRWAGFVSLFFGIVAIVGGLAGAADNPAGAITAALGAFVLAAGIGLQLRLTPQTMLADGAALAGLGIWNLLTAATDSTTAPYGTPHPAVFTAVTGLLMLCFAALNFDRYWQTRAIDVRRIPDSTQVRIGKVLRRLWLSDPKADTGVVEFLPFRSFQVSRKCVAWRGRLYPNAGVFTPADNSDALVASRDDVEVHVDSRSSWGPLTARFYIGDEVMKGHISSNHYDRYRQWKSR